MISTREAVIQLISERLRSGVIARDDLADIWAYLHKSGPSELFQFPLTLGRDGSQRVTVSLTAYPAVAGHEPALGWQIRAGGAWDCPDPHAGLRNGLADLLAGSATPESLRATFITLCGMGRFRDGNVEWSAERQDEAIGGGRIIRQTQVFVV